MYSKRTNRGSVILMPVDEVEVYVTRNGHRRAAIVRRSDGLYCIYRHARWEGSWLTDQNPHMLRYDDLDPEKVATPEPGLFGTVTDARNEVRGFEGFSDAVLIRSGA